MLSRIVATLLLLGGLAVYVLLIPPQTSGGASLDVLPLDLSGLPGEELAIEQMVLDDLNPDAILSRRNTRPDGLPVWLVIIYFENARLGAHDPELCYRSQGFEVAEAPTGGIPTELGPIPVVSFDAVRGSRREMVRYFWYTAGRQTLAEVKAFRDEMFFQGLKSNRSFGAFVRVSTLAGEDPALSEEVLREYIRDLAPYLPRMFPDVPTQAKEDERR